MSTPHAGLPLGPIGAWFNLSRYDYTDDDFAAGLRAHFDAGADHVAVQVLTAGHANPMAAYQQLARVLL